MVDHPSRAILACDIVSGYQVSNGFPTMMKQDDLRWGIKFPGLWSGEDMELCYPGYSGINCINEKSHCSESVTRHS